MSIRNTSFDVLGMSNTTDIALSMSPSDFLGNAELTMHVKKYINKKCSLEKKERNIVNNLKNIDQVNDFFYSQNINYKIKLNSNKFEIYTIEYKENKRHENIKCKFDISKHNLINANNKEFFKLCQLSKKQSFYLRNSTKKLKFKKVNIPKKNGNIRETYSLDGNDEIDIQISKKLNNYLILLQAQLFKNINSYAYQSKRSYKDYLNVHRGSNQLIKVDIKNFFSSINKEMLEYELKKHIKNDFIIDSLLKYTIVANEEILGQGLPNTPALSNIYLLNFDQQIHLFCEKNNYKYSRYCDDMIISSESLILNSSSVIHFIKEKLMGYELDINEGKTHFFDKSKIENIIIGNIRISDQLYLPNSYFRDIYNTLNNILYSQGNDNDALIKYYIKNIHISVNSRHKKQSEEEIREEYLYGRSKLTNIVANHIHGRIQYAIHINKFDYNLSKCIKQYNKAVGLKIINTSKILNHPIYENVMQVFFEGSAVEYAVLKELDGYTKISLPTSKIQKISHGYVYCNGQLVKLCFNKKSEKFHFPKHIKCSGVKNCREYNALKKQIIYFYSDGKELYEY